MVASTAEAEVVSPADRGQDSTQGTKALPPTLGAVSWRVEQIPAALSSPFCHIQGRQGSGCNPKLLNLLNPGKPHLVWEKTVHQYPGDTDAAIQRLRTKTCIEPLLLFHFPTQVMHIDVFK